MAELKPCPFCGGKAGIMRHHHITNAFCFCTVCKARMPNMLTREEAIEAWNRRAENEELKFTRQFIHEQGLEFALASAWKGRAEDGR